MYIYAGSIFILILCDVLFFPRVQVLYLFFHRAYFFWLAIRFLFCKFHFLLLVVNYLGF